MASYFVGRNPAGVLSRGVIEIAAVLPNNYHHCPLTSIDYHPLDHILAISTIEDNGPIHVYIYKKLGIQKKKELKNDLIRQEKHTPSKNYLYNVETSSDEGFAKLSLRTLDMKRDSSDSGN
ncbi:hypothetical protein CEXT_614981 [Caerostris extrusa]|uniref:Uncharacterized protein n=1 Tax=Caerostris extrusa TaxID=172846 RepID=A0AAV4NA64_CAEEX|nr:hypothetical protein CEXT_614981 [Caerostris extrusa]